MTNVFPMVVYSLCFLTSGACALLLARTYRRTRARLLLWSALCFAFLAANNLLVLLDLIVFPALDTLLARQLLSLVALGLLLFGFIWDSED